MSTRYCHVIKLDGMKFNGASVGIIPYAIVDSGAGSQHPWTCGLWLLVEFADRHRLGVFKLETVVFGAPIHSVFIQLMCVVV